MISLWFILTTNLTVKESFSRSKMKTTKPKLFFRTEPSSYSESNLKIFMITTKPKVIFCFFPNGTMILQWVKFKKKFFSNVYDFVLLLTMMVTNSNYDPDESFFQILFFWNYVKCSSSKIQNSKMQIFGCSG